jgi:2-keto-4-pentenoate hydratase/2-oxohepta-3-ene-1,7-dioic acid hydratase in catechol pathway
MRLVTFKGSEGPRVGIVDGDDIVDIGIEGPDGLLDLIKSGKAKEQAAKQGKRQKIADTHFLPTIPRSGKFICVGLNYADHAAEGNNPIPDYPALFVRVNSSLVGHGEPMIVPKASEKFDYEAELTIVIGKTCRHVSEDKALDYVFGYTIFNDGSIRDYQRKSTQWTAGKNFDGTGPLGPWIVTADEVPPGAKGLGIRSILNGSQVLQNSNTDNLIFDTARLVSIISEVMTLEPGDLIATGTPGGVGYPRKPPIFLKKGDMIAVEIDKIGRLENPVANAA